MDREKFKIAQEQMIKNWIDGVTNLTGNYNAYRKLREKAYLGRWKEAARFLKPGDYVLDIGGGALYNELFDFIKSCRFNYYYQDISSSLVGDCKKLAAINGFDVDNFREGFNDELDYPVDYFDAVFSSHCLEHSFDIKSTFSGLNKIIKKSGYLLIAVPLGWEINPEHPYFFSPNEWIAILEDNGFQIRVAQVGCEYPENGWDYFIAAKKIEDVHQFQRIDPEDFKKNNFVFIDKDDASIIYNGIKKRADDFSYSIYGGEHEIIIHTNKHYRYILPIFAHHNYSGNIIIKAKEYIQLFDLYSWFSFIQPEMVVLDGLTDVVIKSIGKNFCSFGNEIVFYGYLVPKNVY